MVDNLCQCGHPPDKHTHDGKGVCLKYHRHPDDLCPCVQFEEPATTDRPWGSFTILADEEDHKVKRLVVNPGCKLSLQYHMKRDEHWYFVSGISRSSIDGKIYFTQPHASLFIRREQRHRIENVGTEPLVIIEVQTGDYFGEDDIIRKEDDYGRA